MEISLPARFEDLRLYEYIAIRTENDPVKLLSIVSGMTQGSVRKLPSAVFDRATAHIQTLCDTETAKHVKVLEIAGKSYGFIPDWREFTTGEWIDMEALTQDLYTNAPKIMALLYRPISYSVGGAYEIAEYTAKEDPAPFRDVKAEVYLGVLLFFSTTRREWLNSTIQSLGMIADQATASLKNGVGTTFYSRWRSRMFYAWMRLRNSR
jgi:hypothetical protein